LIVLDASAAVCLLLNDPIQQADQVKQRLQGEDLHAPHLIDLEVAQALRRLVLARAVAATRAEEALSDLIEFPLTRHPHYPFLTEIWRMRSNRTAYDGAYVALAELLGAPLNTLDARMARSSAAVTIEIF
jgi:predicted nucleic acid-binding protein